MVAWVSSISSAVVYHRFCLSRSCAKKHDKPSFIAHYDTHADKLLKEELCEQVLFVLSLARYS